MEATAEAKSSYLEESSESESEESEESEEKQLLKLLLRMMILRRLTILSLLNEATHAYTPDDATTTTIASLVGMPLVRSSEFMLMLSTYPSPEAREVGN